MLSRRIYCQPCSLFFSIFDLEKIRYLSVIEAKIFMIYVYSQRSDQTVIFILGYSLVSKDSPKKIRGLSYAQES